MSGYSRVRIFTPTGIELVELNVSTIRSWTLNDIGRCQFKLGIYDAATGKVNPNVNETVLNYGNYVLVEHTPSRNPDGTYNGILPPWVGVILPPRSWNYGIVTVTAMSAEQVLFFRCSPEPLFITGTPGAMFIRLIQYANDQNFNPMGFPIQIGDVFAGGVSGSRQVKISIQEEIKELVGTSGGEWCITPALDANNRLSLVANYYQSMGTDVGRVFSNVNMEAGSPTYIEQGFFYNWCRGYSQFASSGNVNFAAQFDAAAISKNGLMGVNQSFTGIAGEWSTVGTEQVAAAVATFLSHNKFPVRTIAPNVFDIGNDFSFLRIGNTWQIYLDTVGFTQGRLGLIGKVRITAMEYSELQNQVRLAATLQ